MMELDSARTCPLMSSPSVSLKPSRQVTINSTPQVTETTNGATITKTNEPSTKRLLRVGARGKLDSQGDQTRNHSTTANRSDPRDWNQEKYFQPPKSYGCMPPRRPTAIRGNHRPTRTCCRLQKEGQAPQSPLIWKSLQRSILLLYRLRGY